MPVTAQSEVALFKIRLIIIQTRYSWLAELNETTSAEKAAARALQSALTNFFKRYRGYVLAQLLNARETIEGLLRRVIDDPVEVEHKGKRIRLRFVRASAKQRKLRCESELWKALDAHGLSDQFRLVHKAVMPLCGYPRAKAISFERYLRLHRPKELSTAHEESAAAPLVPPNLQPLVELLRATEAAPKSSKKVKTENRSKKSEQQSARRRK
jgi:hypothetical protein